MRKALAVAARELRERWLLFPAGLALGFITLTLPAFGVPASLSPTVVLLIAVLLGAVAALVIGSSMLARDAVDGRLGFLFSHPVPWPTIWGGKWLAALVLVAGSGALAFLPWMLVHPPEARGGSWGAAFLDPGGSAFFLLLLLLGVGVLGVGLANFNATAFRSRSAWLALDLGLLLLALWGVTLWVAPLYTLRIVWPFAGGLGFLFPVGPVALGLFVASAAQVALGRTDIRRAHRAMSVVFWAIVFVALAGAGLRLAWARGAEPSDITVHLHRGKVVLSSRWLYVVGASGRGGAASFLIDGERGRYLPMGLHWSWAGSRGVTFSGDGRSGAILARDSNATTLDLADLSGPKPRFTRVRLEDSPPPDRSAGLALSESGSSVLLTHGHGASLFAVPSGRRVATATLPPGWHPRAGRFLGESAARIWLTPPVRAQSTPEIRILDFGAGLETRWIRVSLGDLDPVRGWGRGVHPDADGRRFLSRDGGVRLRDGATGTLLATLVETTAPVATAFVADGRIVVGEAVGPQIRLHVFSKEGTPLRQATLDRLPLMLGVGPELAPGQVAVHSGGAFYSTTTLVFDITEGRVVKTLPDMRPAPGLWRPGSPEPAAGAEVPTVHFFVRGGDLVRLDFATGEERVVAGSGAPAQERLAR